MLRDGCKQLRQPPLHVQAQLQQLRQPSTLTQAKQSCRQGRQGKHGAPLGGGQRHVHLQQQGTGSVAELNWS